MHEKIISAHWILPVATPPIRNGAIAISGNRILAVGERDSIVADHPTMPVEDHPRSAIIPGLINAHTHLEFSNLEQPLGHQGISLPDWIRDVINARSTSTADAKRESIVRGLKELYETGTVAVGEISTLPTNTTADYAAQPSVHKTVFLEQLTRNLDLLSQRQSEALSHLAQQKIIAALGPHAPYSTHPQLVEQIIDLAVKEDVPVAMHVAETREELELLEHRSGKFVDLLQDLGVWDSDSFGDADSIDHIIEQLGRHSRSLLVHGNYLTDAQLKRIAQLGISIAFCPRTHAWFGHAPYPLARMIELGINVATGTDSRASNPDLNLLEELKLIARTHPDVAGSSILAMATRGGASAIGIEKDYGTIESGKLAALTRIEPGNSTDDPWAWLSIDSSSAHPPVVTGD